MTTVPPASASAGARTSTGSMLGVPLAAARRDGRVAAQLPAGQHGERDQAEIRARAGGAGEHRLPAAPDPGAAGVGAGAGRSTG